MTEVSKSGFATKKEREKRNIQGSAIAGAGGVVAGTGLLAGGIPGAKSDFTGVLRAADNIAATKGQKRGPKKAASTVRGASPALKAVPGGILGFRMHAHKGGLYDFDDKAKAANKKPPKDAVGNFYRGRNEGKIPAEAKVLRGMGRGRAVANAALVGGVATSAFGVKRKNDVSKRDKKNDTYNATLAGAGGTGAAVSHGASKYLDGHKRKYEAAAAAHVDEAGKIAPKTAGRREKNWSYNKKLKYMAKNPGQPIPKGPSPSISDGAIKQHPEMLEGLSRQKARKVGQLRGMATQERHFADVFGSTSKVVRSFRTPSAIAGAIGVGGLAATEKQKKKIVKSSTSAFGVDHG